MNRMIGQYLISAGPAPTSLDSRCMDCRNTKGEPMKKLLTVLLVVLVLVALLVAALPVARAGPEPPVGR